MKTEPNKYSPPSVEPAGLEQTTASACKALQVPGPPSLPNLEDLS